MDGGTDGRRITIHQPADFAGMRTAGRLAAETLDMIAPHVRPGVSTEQLNRICHDFILAHGAVPAPLNYRGYPKSVCISINHVVCHGIPGERLLEAGDILNIDVTVILDGWYGDSSRMYCAGPPSTKARNLIDVTHESLLRGIAAARPGATFGDIGHAIQGYVEPQRFSVVRDFCGHGIGRRFHEAPNVLHYGRPGDGATLKPGMFFTIEPMVNAGRPEVKILDDGWTAVTRDRSLSAQFEHMIGITETGCEVFTLSPAGLFNPPYPQLMPAPHVTTQKLRFCDTDSLGHVNNAVYAVMLEAGRAEMAEAAGLLIPRGRFAIVIARLELDFLREMTWPGAIRIESAFHALDTRRMHLRQRLYQGETLTARAASTLAAIDTQTRRAVTLTDEWRAALGQWLLPEF